MPLTKAATIKAQLHSFLLFLRIYSCYYLTCIEIQKAICYVVFGLLATAVKMSEQIMGS